MREKSKNFEAQQKKIVKIESTESQIERFDSIKESEKFDNRDDTAAAVFDIHMDKNAVANINPRITFRALTPIKDIILIAIRLCKFHYSIPIAIKKPPKYRNTNL